MIEQSFIICLHNLESLFQIACITGASLYEHFQQERHKMHDGISAVGLHRPDLALLRYDICLCYIFMLSSCHELWRCYTVVQHHLLCQRGTMAPPRYAEQWIVLFPVTTTNKRMKYWSTTLSLCASPNSHHFFKNTVIFYQNFKHNLKL